MSDIAVAALLAATILIGSTISVEIGISVALIELLAGVIVGNAFHLDVPAWLAFLGSFAGIVLTFQAGAEVDVPQFRREWKASLSIGLVSLLRALRRRRPRRLLRPRLEPSSGRDRRSRALDDEPRRRLRRARRDRPEPRARRQAADVGDLRHRHRHRRGPDRAVRQADPLDRPVRRRLGRPDPRAAEGCALVLPSLRQPGDRAGDQARLRLALPPDVARRPGQLAGSAARVRPRPGDEQPLRPAPAPSRSGCASSPSRS